MILKSDLINTISKAAIIGTVIVFAINIACLAIAYSQADSSKSEIEQIGLLTIILAVVGAADLVIGFILKKKLLSPLFNQDTQNDKAILWQYAFKTTLVTASICAALPVYGLVSIFIDSNMNAMVGFSIASLAGFMFLRLRPRDFEALKIN